MMSKTVCLFITLLVGSMALPLNEDRDMSLFFDRQVSFPRIVGGTVAAGSVPHMVALTTGILSRFYTCGGSLVSNRHVLTAAHCITPLFSNGALLSSLRAVVGTSRWSTGGYSYSISHNISHPDWNTRTFKNDIGILVTSSAVLLNAEVQIVPLNYNFIDIKAVVVNGWGWLFMGAQQSSPRLMELRLNIVDGNQCVTDVARKAKELNLKAPAVNPEIEICASGAANTGTCSGDSGSALILAERREQIGIVAWGLMCARGAPDMYTRISAYQSWIQQNLRLTK